MKQVDRKADLPGKRERLPAQPYDQRAPVMGCGDGACRGQGNGGYAEAVLVLTDGSDAQSDGDEEQRRPDRRPLLLVGDQEPVDQHPGQERVEVPEDREVRLLNAEERRDGFADRRPHQYRGYGDHAPGRGDEPGEHERKHEVKQELDEDRPLDAYQGIPRRGVEDADERHLADQDFGNVLRH